MGLGRNQPHFLLFQKFGGVPLVGHGVAFVLRQVVEAALKVGARLPKDGDEVGVRAQEVAAACGETKMF